MKAFLLALLGVLASHSAFAGAKTALQWGVDRTVSPWQTCIYDSANVCQSAFTMPSTGGPVLLPAGALAPGAAAANLGAPLGTSGATIPLNNGNNTTSGNNTHNGAETFNGANVFTGTVTLPAGTAATNLGAALGTSGATIPLNNGNNTESGTWTFNGGVTINIPGADPSGATDSTTAFQAAFTAAAAGGTVSIPCGVYSLSASITATIPTKSAMVVRGGGQQCVTLNFKGSSGLAITLTDQFSSLLVSDLTLTTNDSTGAYKALNLVNPTKLVYPTITAWGTVVIRNVVYRGVDGYTAGQDYWGAGLNEKNVSNINIQDGGFFGALQSGTYLGNPITLSGDVAQTSYSAVVNISGFQVLSCNVGVSYGDFLQGVTITGGSNFTNCVKGVVAIDAPTGTPDQLAISDSQFNTSSVGVHAVAMNGLQVHHNLFIVTAGTAIEGAGNAFAIDHNFIQNGAGGVAGIGANISTGSAIGGSVNDNTFQNFTTAFEATSSGNSVVNVHDNRMSGNTTNYVVTNNIGGVSISDPTPYTVAAGATNMPTCSPRYAGASWKVDDQNSTTYLAAPTGGGGNWGTMVCNGFGYQFH